LNVQGRASKRAVVAPARRATDDQIIDNLK
jgi:hypothetical protein